MNQLNAGSAPKKRAAIPIRAKMIRGIAEGSKSSLRTCGQPSRDWVCTISKEGAPYLRFLQGWAAMLHALLDLLRHGMDQQTCPGIPDSRPSQGTRRTGHPQEKENLPAKGKVFLLDIPFYRTRPRLSERSRNPRYLLSPSHIPCTGYNASG